MNAACLCQPVAAATIIGVAFYVAKLPNKLFGQPIKFGRRVLQPPFKCSELLDDTICLSAGRVMDYQPKDLLGAAVVWKPDAAIPPMIVMKMGFKRCIKVDASGCDLGVPQTLPMLSFQCLHTGPKCTGDHRGRQHGGLEGPFTPGMVAAVLSSALGHVSELGMIGHEVCYDIGSPGTELSEPSPVGFVCRG